MTYQYKKLPVTMKMWMPFNVMPRTSLWHSLPYHLYPHCHQIQSKNSPFLFLAPYNSIHAILNRHNHVDFAYNRIMLCYVMLVILLNIPVMYIVLTCTQWYTISTCRMCKHQRLLPCLYVSSYCANFQHVHTWYTHQHACSPSITQ